jgi:hypothetical protein
VSLFPQRFGPVGFPEAELLAACAAPAPPFIPTSGAHGSRQRPSIGRIVHYVLSENDSKYHPGDHRPAIIVNVWSDECVNLQVFTDGANDNDYRVPMLWVTSSTRDDSGAEHRSWHFPERVE